MHTVHIKQNSYQYAVEELVNKQTQHAHNDVSDVKKKEDIHDDRLVPSGERALVPHETHQEHNFIQQLWRDNATVPLELYERNRIKNVTVNLNPLDTNNMPEMPEGVLCSHKTTISRNI